MDHADRLFVLSTYHGLFHANCGISSFGCRPDGVNIVGCDHCGLWSLFIRLGYYKRQKAKDSEVTASNVQAELGDAHVKEAHIAEGVEKHAEPTTTPVSVSSMPTQIIAPIPVMTPTSVKASAPLENELLALKGSGEKGDTVESTRN